MAAELGAWLRTQRQARGWNASEMARQLRRAAKSNGDVLPGNQALFTYLRRWEHGAVIPSERYALHYCRAFGIEPARFGEALADTAALPQPSVPDVLPASSDADLSTPPHVAYRWFQESDLRGSWIEREVLMTAHDGFGMEALAHIDLAAARFRTDNLDAAAIALAPVLSLPTGKRIKNLPQRLGRVRAELARPRYQGSAQARELDEHIEEFTRDTIVAGLHELPG